MAITLFDTHRIFILSHLSSCSSTAGVRPSMREEYAVMRCPGSSMQIEKQLKLSVNEI